MFYFISIKHHAHKEEYMRKSSGPATTLIHPHKPPGLLWCRTPDPQASASPGGSVQPPRRIVSFTSAPTSTLHNLLLLLNLFIPYHQESFTIAILASTSTPSTTSFHTARSHLPPTSSTPSESNASASRTITASNFSYPSKMSPPRRGASPIQRLQKELGRSEERRVGKECPV